jgi:hypothetical protein
MQQYNRHILTAPEPPVFSIRYFLYLFTRAKNLEGIQGINSLTRP